MTLDTWQWAALCFGGLLIGLSKTGLTGLTIFAVASYALILPARESTGVVLPLLMTADLVAVVTYRRDAVWPHLIRLFPWAGLGVALGYFALGFIDSAQVGRLIGGVIAALVALRFWRTFRGGENETVPRRLWFTAAVGILVGFTTMVANASGPIMVLYLLAMRFPKIEFLGTTAWFFLIINWFKVPFSLALGLINANSLPIDAAVAPFTIAGALFGRPLITRINQRLFENLTLVLAFVAGIRLLFG